MTAKEAKELFLKPKVEKAIEVCLEEAIDNIWATALLGDKCRLAILPVAGFEDESNLIMMTAVAIKLKELGYEVEIRPNIPALEVSWENA